MPASAFAPRSVLSGDQKAAHHQAREMIDAEDSGHCRVLLNWSCGRACSMSYLAQQAKPNTTTYAPTY